MREPNHNVYCADVAEAFFQKTPNRKTVVIGGAICAITSLMPLNKLSYRLSKGNNAREAISAIPADILPVFTNCLSLVSGRYLLYKSKLTRVAIEFSAPEIWLIKPDNNAATNTPTSPVGTNCVIMSV